MRIILRYLSLRNPSCHSMRVNSEGVLAAFSIYTPLSHGIGSLKVQI